MLAPLVANLLVLVFLCSGRSMQAGGRPGPHAEGEAGNCAEFVFGHCLQQQRLQELLQLPDAFNDALAQWLQTQVGHRMGAVPRAGQRGLHRGKGWLLAGHGRGPADSQIWPPSWGWLG